MKNTKIINLVGLAKRICQPVSFPLSDQTIEQISTLKLAFRNSFAEYNIYTLGLSAPQIDVWKRFIIIPQNFLYGQITDFKKLKHRVRHFNVYINPRILKASDEQIQMNEYCLSVGDFEYKVMRPKAIEVEYYKEDGTVRQQKLDSLRSRIFQHQLDHLNGILMSELPEAKLITNNK